MNIQSMTQSARAAAIQRLIDAHYEEWQTLIGEERVKRGLSRNTARSALSAENMQLRRRIAELEAKMLA